MRRGRTLTAAQVAAAVSLAIPRRSVGVMRISIVKGVSHCRFSGTNILGVRRGTCRVRVVLDPVRGADVVRVTTVTVT